ncbi:MAG: hypothetical protein SFT81_03420 [Candidatus Caenarcaniphilales bacterium]|nr:hypothetical protein [Candidatus Caenarcaniphilales bacterium]
MSSLKVLPLGSGSRSAQFNRATNYQSQLSSLVSSDGADPAADPFNGYIPNSDGGTRSNPLLRVTDWLQHHVMASIFVLIGTVGAGLGVWFTFFRRKPSNSSSLRSAYTAPSSISTSPAPTNSNRQTAPNDQGSPANPQIPTNSSGILGRIKRALVGDPPQGRIPASHSSPRDHDWSNQKQAEYFHLQRQIDEKESQLHDLPNWFQRTSRLWTLNQASFAQARSAAQASHAQMKDLRQELKKLYQRSELLQREHKARIGMRIR